jgi:hypothetical protein
MHSAGNIYVSTSAVFFCAHRILMKEMNVAAISAALKTADDAV